MILKSSGRIRRRNIHSIIVDEFLREVIDHAFDAAANAFVAIRLSRSKFASDLMSFTLRAWGRVNLRGEGVGKDDSQARDLEILGAAGRESPERLGSLGESRPASVEERFSGVEASMRPSVMLRHASQVQKSLAGKRKEKIGAVRVWISPNPPALEYGLVASTASAFPTSILIFSAF